MKHLTTDMVKKGKIRNSIIGCCSTHRLYVMAFNTAFILSSDQVSHFYNLYLLQQHRTVGSDLDRFPFGTVRYEVR